MKFYFSLLAFCLFAVNGLQAQQFSAKASVTLVEASEVPEAVKTSQEQHFPGMIVRQWKMQTYQGSRTAPVNYLAVFNNEGKNTRARYLADGQGISTYTNYRPQALPPAIVQTLNTDYAGYTPTGAALVGSLHNDWEAFHISLRKGGQKLSFWLTTEGDLIIPRELPQQIEEEVTE